MTYVSHEGQLEKKSKCNFKKISTQIVLLLSFEKGCAYMMVLLLGIFCGFPNFHLTLSGMGSEGKKMLIIRATKEQLL